MSTIFPDFKSVQCFKNIFGKTLWVESLVTPKYDLYKMPQVLERHQRLCPVSLYNFAQSIHWISVTFADGWFLEFEVEGVSYRVQFRHVYDSPWQWTSREVAWGRWVECEALQGEIVETVAEVCLLISEYPDELQDEWDTMDLIVTRIYSHPPL